MTSQDTQDSADMDDGTSLEKAIEKLDKDDPEYASKREKMTERLHEFRQELNQMHKEVKKQQREAHAALKALHRQAEVNPDNGELQHLLATTELDKSFLTRAVAEIISAKGNLEQEMKRLTTSKEFNQPLDMKLVSNIKVKPLPSSYSDDRRDKIKTAVRKNPAQQMSIGRRILMLRQTTPGQPRPTGQSSGKIKAEASKGRARELSH